MPDIRASREAKKHPNVILITPDQLRADHLSCYGSSRKTSPNIDALAQQGTLFLQYYAVASWTTPTFVSMLTSQTPSRHGATLFGSRIFDTFSTPIVSAQFEMAGYKTVAFCNNAHATNPLLASGNQPAIRGFKELYIGETVFPPNITKHLATSARNTTKAALQWLDRNCSEPFFMWILYIEPHSPYNPPLDHDIFKSDSYPDEFNNGYSPERGAGWLYRLANAGERCARERLVELYDGKIHFVDYYIGQVYEKLKNLKILDNTHIIVTSDHGELLYEHDDCLTFDHRSLYDANTHVPLIVKGPGVPADRRTQALCNQLDIGPTILDLAGLPALAGAQGRSLVPVMANSKESIHKYIFAEQDVLERLRSIRTLRYKLIYRPADDASYLFDLLSDSAELKNIAKHYPEKLNAMLKRLKRYMERNEPDPGIKRRHWEMLCPKSEVIDDVTIGARVQLFGSSYSELPLWVRMAEGGENYCNACYWLEPGDGSRGAIWRSDNPLFGSYSVYIWYGKLLDRASATDAQVSVVTAHTIKTATLNQNSNTGQWNHLGTFMDPLYVKITDKANGPIIVDAVKLERVD